VPLLGLRLGYLGLGLALHVPDHARVARDDVTECRPGGGREGRREIGRVVPRQPADASGGVDRDVALNAAAEDVHQHVGKVTAGVAGELVQPDQVDDLGLSAGLFAHIADDRVDRALAGADLAAGQAPKPVTLALLAE
jgi:hypothetical protein